MASEHTDVLRESVAWLVAEHMEAEVSTQIGAELGERAPGRASATAIAPAAGRRAGEVELAGDPEAQDVPRAPQAIGAGALGRRAGGLRQRRLDAQVDRLVEQLGIAGMSKDQVSRPCQGLDYQVAAFRERPLEGRHPYLWRDAKV